jgi:hypothetical protein
MLANVPFQSIASPLDGNSRLIDAVAQSRVVAPGKTAHAPFQPSPHFFMDGLAFLKLAFQPDGIGASHSLSLGGLIIQRARILAASCSY